MNESSPLLKMEERSCPNDVNIELFEQHNDDDVIIPDKIAFPLVISSHLLLVTAVVAIIFQHYGIFAVIFAVYLTSIWHWSKPRFSRIARYADYIAVFTAVIYGSYVAAHLSMKYYLIWFCGLGLISIIFITNESMFYFQTMKRVDGKTTLQSNLIDLEAQTQTVCCGLQSTQKNTPERDFVYKRTVWVHLICVHVLANVLALILVIGNS